MLRHRLITGTLLIAGLLGLLWLDGWTSAAWKDAALPAWTGGADGLVLSLFTAVVLVPIVTLELVRMLRGMGISAPYGLSLVAALAGLALFRVQLPEDLPRAAVAGTVIWVVLMAALVVHTRGRSVQGVVQAMGGTLLAALYVGAMLGMWLQVRTLVGPWVLAGAVLTIKASDTGAYATGMTMGRHKMIPWLSPGKTWEGAVGGVAGAALVGALLAWWSMQLPDARDHVPVWLGALGGAVLGVVAPIGDLAESLLKRAAGVKDSGTLLPGMGGALDVVDSPLLAGPVVFWLLELRSPCSV